VVKINLLNVDIETNEYGKVVDGGQNKYHFQWIFTLKMYQSIA